MIILGISHPISWNPAACLVIDGKLVAFAEEERFVRLKHAPHMHPENAIRFCLKRAGIDSKDVDVTAIGFAQPNRKVISSSDITGYLDNKLTDETRFEFHTRIAHLNADTLLHTYGRRMYFEHHLCHAASAAIPSRFSKTNLITLDGWGGSVSGLCGSFDRENGFRILTEVSPFNSWGIAYELITHHLGFRCHSAEGKTMGLASYGSPDHDLLPDFCDSELGLPDVKKYESFLDAKLPSRKAGEELQQWHCDLAATMQNYYEASLIRIAKHLVENNHSSNFVLAGGVALNCTGNGLLAQQDFVDKLFVQPASHDAGTALGAAILAHRELVGDWPEMEFTHAYWGASYEDSDIEHALGFANVTYQRCDPVETAAAALAENKVVGWFQGAAELGPRALGNRSILAHPGYKQNLDRVNLQVKRREQWRPLAPSILEEKYFEIIDTRILSPFMLIAAQVKQEWRDRLPAIVHVDGSARPQAVSADTNEIYHRMISRFEELSGLPAVLNTSFNLDDEPLVNSPENAIATFFRSGIEILILGNYVVQKRIT